MSGVTADELLKKAAACEECGKPHEYRWVSANQASWAADDGHSYRPAVDMGVVAKLRYLATGQWIDPWAPPKKPLMQRLLT
jgi:hypothetical protein